MQFTPINIRNHEHVTARLTSGNDHIPLDSGVFIGPEMLAPPLECKDGVTEVNYFFSDVMPY